MIYFWLGMSIVLIVSITYFGITEGFNKWAFYYVYALLAILMYFVRKWMVKRMEKHQQFLENQKKKKV